MANTGLRPKQIEFIKAYTTPNQEGYLNASESARIAGYSKKSCGSGGTMLLKNPVIGDEVQRILESRDKKLQTYIDITKDEYLTITRQALDEVGSKHSNFTKLLEIIGKVKGFFNEVANTQILIYNDSQDELSENQAEVSRKIKALIRQKQSPQSSPIP